MESPSQAPAGMYIVSCCNCKALFDALEASWCSCIVRRRSFVCSSCLRCFCKAPRSYKQALWENAPQTLWDRALEEQHPDYEPPAPPEDPDDTERPLVLVVDDEADIQRVALSAIESLGYGAVVARDGEEGLALARRLKPELILTDALMPKLDGRQMCLRLKQEGATAKTPVVIMTSLYTAPHYKYEACGAFRADGFIAKPLDFQELQETLRKHLG